MNIDYSECKTFLQKRWDIATEKSGESIPDSVQDKFDHTVIPLIKNSSCLDIYIESATDDVINRYFIEKASRIMQENSISYKKLNESLTSISKLKKTYIEIIIPFSVLFFAFGFIIGNETFNSKSIEKLDDVYSGKLENIISTINKKINDKNIESLEKIFKDGNYFDYDNTLGDYMRFMRCVDGKIINEGDDYYCYYKEYKIKLRLSRSNKQ